MKNMSNINNLHASDQEAINFTDEIIESRLIKSRVSFYKNELAKLS